ncbi:MAG TPA: AAA family ATPase [Streptosporangiaceae bacterium]|nr:AAA family ATPase [Streptosporangiaceae bacterium]
MNEQRFAALTETHSAVVYFAGDRAFKLKKPVKLDFLDFSTRQSRAAACARETELNRRFAPDVYLGVAEVRAPDGQVCDHLVVMRRMPTSRRLSALVEAREPVSPAVRQVARILATQHAAAKRSPQISQQGGRDAIWRRWHDNIDQFRTAASDELVADAEINEAGRLADRFLVARQELFDARIRSGRIVDGHGDLMAADIFCLDDGPRILDCLDFDDKLRWVDGLDDASFLAMDLEQLGAPNLAEQFIRWYSEYSGDPAPVALRHHYVAYRAIVRAKVACIGARQSDRAAPGQARHLLAAALRHLRAGAVTLVLVGGPPGTGKSALACAIADRLGFTVLSSDRIRKELAGIEPAQHVPADYGNGIYTQSWTERTYAEIVSRAIVLLGVGESVVLDASWTSARHRQAVAAAADRAGADLVQLRCSAPLAVTTNRVSSRIGGASDATPAIAARLAAEQDTWPEATVIDTADECGPADSSPSTPVRQALEVIRPHGPEHVWRPVRPYMAPD